MRAAEHAAKAAELLDALVGLDEQVDGLDDGDRLGMAVSGATRQLNENRRYTIELATAHSLAALALERTVERPRVVHRGEVGA